MAQNLKVYDRFSCENCADKGRLDFDFTMAFQPIINCQTNQVFGYEALVRGLNNESAFSIISKVNDDNRYLFDQLCRVKAIALAAKLNLDSMLSINFYQKLSTYQNAVFALLSMQPKNIISPRKRSCLNLQKLSRLRMLISLKASSSITVD